MTMVRFFSRRVRLNACCLVALGGWLCMGTADAGTWQPVGVGDCLGRDVASSRGSSVPEADKCDASFAGYTAICWADGCNYKSVATRSCTGGASPGQMYTCVPSAPAAPITGWESVGLGDCLGHDVAGTSGPNPDPTKCSTSFAGNTAICWTTGCTYKSVPTGSCTGGAHPGQMYTCGVAAPPPPAPARVGWESVGLGDCYGRDVTGTSGPNPDPTKCNASFAGYTAVCWTTGCTYKNVPTGSCTGGAHPGQMYTCGGYAVAAATALPPPTVPPPAVPSPVAGGRHRRPATSAPPTEGWESVGIGDCPAREVAGTAGPTPDPSRCNGSFAGKTAVCWASGCSYKDVPTASCKGGANPGQMYTCAANAAAPPLPPPAPPKAKGKHYAIVNYTGDTQNPHTFVVDWKTCKVAELSQEYEHGTEDINVLVCRPGSRLVIKVDFRTTGYWVQYDWIVLDNGATMAGSYRDPTTCGPSVGKRAR